MQIFQIEELPNRQPERRKHSVAKRIEEREQPQTYYCIWYDDKTVCKIRTQSKLKPESLSMFCAICPLRIADAERSMLKVRKEA